MTVTMKPRYAEIIVCNQISTVSSDTLLYDQCLVSGSSVISAIVSNVEFAVPDKESETTFYFGQDVNSAQNAETETNPLGAVELTFTAKKDDFDLEKYMFAKSTTTTDITRYNFGTEATQAISLAIRIRRTVSGTTYTRDYLLRTPVVTQTSSWSAGSEDTKLEGDFKVTCVAKEVYKDFKSA